MTKSRSRSGVIDRKSQSALNVLELCVLEVLERRQLMAISGTTGARAFLSDRFQDGFETKLEARMASFSGDANSKFDQALLDLMRRPGQGDTIRGDNSVDPTYPESGFDGVGSRRFFVSLTSSDSISSIDTAPQRAQDVYESAWEGNVSTENTLAGEQDDVDAAGFDPSQTYTSPFVGNGQEEAHRHFHWETWARYYHYEKLWEDNSGTIGLEPPATKFASRFVTKIVNDFAQWRNALVGIDQSNELRPYTYATGGVNTFAGALLDMVERLTVWTNVYPLIAESSLWTADTNTEFMYHYFLQANSVYEHSRESDGDPLYPQARTVSDAPETVTDGRGFNPVDHNKILNQAQALLYAGNAFPEFNNSVSGSSDASDWRGAARDILYGPIINGTDRDDTKSEIQLAFYDDGGPVEASDNYGERQLRDLLEIAYLDDLGNNAEGSSNWMYWDDTISGDSRTYIEFLADVAQARYQTLAPDTARFEYGDSNGGFGAGVISLADYILNAMTNGSGNFPSYDYEELAAGAEYVDPSDAWTVGFVGSTATKVLLDRGYSNSASDGAFGVGANDAVARGVAESGIAVVRSGDSSYGATSSNPNRQARVGWFRGGDPDGTSAPLVGSMGEGAHTDADLLNFTYYAWDEDLIPDLGSDYEESGYHSLMTPYSSYVRNAEHRKYEPRSGAFQDTNAVQTFGRWDYAGPTSSLPERGYRQNTSWTNAWHHQSGSPTISGGGDVLQMARSIWMPNDGSTSATDAWGDTSVLNGRYGMAVIVDWADGDGTTGSQSYASRFNINTSILNGTPTAVTDGGSTVGYTYSSSSRSMQIRQVGGGPQSLTTSDLTDVNHPRQFESKTGAISNNDKILIAHVVTSGNSSNPREDVDADWVSVDANGVSTLRVRFEDNTGVSGDDQQAWQVRFAKPDSSLTNPSAGSALEVETAFDQYKGLEQVDSTFGGVAYSALRGFENGDFVRINNVNFGSGFNTIRIRAGVDASTAGTFKVYANTSGGTMTEVGSFTLASTGGFTTLAEQTFSITSVSGVKDLVVRSTGGQARIDWVKFENSGSTTVQATADSYVRDGGSASTNYGSATELEAKQSTSGFNRRAYLKFDISSFSSSISSAKLRLFGSLNDTGSILFNANSISDTSWTESGITWNNAPSLGSTIGTATVVNTTDAWYEFDITSFVQTEKTAGRNTISIAIAGSTSSSPFFGFASREVTNKPEIQAT